MTTPLRPMSLGELLDRSFFLYRTHFRLFVGIIALPYLLVLAFQLLSVALRFHTNLAFTLVGALASLASLILYMGVVAASQGATVIAVSKVHLDSLVTISEAFAGIRGRIFYLALIMSCVGFAVGIGLLLLIVPGVMLALMWALVIPVAVLEDRGLRDATTRSADLTKGSRGRVFVVGLLFVILTYIVYVLWELPILAAIGIFTRGHSPLAVIPVWTQIAFPVGSFLSQCLVGPLLTIALSLLYFDQRVRKEGFNLELMTFTLDRNQGGPAAPSSA